MIVAIKPDELEARGKEFLSDSKRDVLVIKQEGQVLGALISPEDYESLRQLRAQRAVDAMNSFGKHMESVATPEELQELVRELDTHNS
jgi:hypothetical protein